MRYLFVLLAVFTLYSCGGSPESKTAENQSSDETYVPAGKSEEDIKKVDPNRGIGKFTHVELSPQLDQAMAATGKGVYEVKCMSCHRLDETRLVGPGWKGVTSRRTPEWIMNFSTNTEEMLNRDPESMAMLEICLVRMPNQNLADADARALLEYMRENDGVK